jgi:hypothetical protein
MGGLQGIAAMRLNLAAYIAGAHLICQDGPRALRAAGVDALLADHPAAGSVTDHLGIPFGTVYGASPLSEDAVLMRASTARLPWRYATTLVRARLADAVGRQVSKPLLEAIVQYRRAWTHR